VIDLGAANLTIAAIEFDTPEALFQREVAARVPDVVGEEIREVDLAQGILYALDAGGLAQPRKTKLAIDRQVRSREVILLIHNLDSPPLAITTIRATRRPVFVVFQARQSDEHVLYAGNNQCPAPQYDLGGLGAQLKTAPASALVPGRLAPNPNYHAPETLPGLAETGAALDTRPWRFRKPVRIGRPGPQQLELDLDILAHARPDLSDLRLMRNGNQVPYLVQRTSLARPINPVVTQADDPKQPRQSRWKIALPGPNLPLTRLDCRTRTALFQRNVRLWEELPDGRGGRYQSAVGSADWKRTADSKDAALSIPVNSAPQTDTLMLETDNGDNPPIELERFSMTYPVTRLVFKATESPEVYYGNPAVPAPRYDLNLVAMKLLAADKAVASLGAEETLRKPGWTEGEPLTGARAWLFWGILALVVAGLIVVIVRLLPKPPAGPSAAGETRGK
jgi:hypothetical protein